MSANNYAWKQLYKSGRLLLPNPPLKRTELEIAKPSRRCLSRMAIMRHSKPKARRSLSAWKDERHFIKRDLPTARGLEDGGEVNSGDIEPAFAFHLVRGSDSFVITMTAKKSGIDLPFFTKFMSLWATSIAAFAVLSATTSFPLKQNRWQIYFIGSPLTTPLHELDP